MKGRRPNILILMADQLGAGALPAYGHRLVKAPNIDRIAASGASSTISTRTSRSAPRRGSRS